MRYLLATIALALVLAQAPAQAASPAGPGTQPTTAPAAVTLPATNPTTVPTASAAMVAPAAPNSPTAPAGEDFAPGLLVFALLMLLLMLIAIALIAVVALLFLAAGAVLLLCGMISTSLLVGLVARARAAAVRTFIVQACAVAGVPLGIFTMWLENRLFHLFLPYKAILLIGGPGGMIVGAGSGYILCFAVERLARFLLRGLRPAQTIPTASPAPASPTALATQQG